MAKESDGGIMADNKCPLCERGVVYYHYAIGFPNFIFKECTDCKSKEMFRDRRTYNAPIPHEDRRHGQDNI